MFHQEMGEPDLLFTFTAQIKVDHFLDKFISGGELLRKIQLSESQVIELVDRVEARMLQREVREKEQVTFVKPRIVTNEKPGKEVGRPKSKYTGQLHLSILEEDEVWFKKTARANNLQYGKFFTHLRRVFDLYG